MGTLLPPPNNHSYIFVEENVAVSDAAVAAGSTYFLHVVLQRLRHVIVNDSADVCLVDAHTERHRRDDNSYVTGRKTLLNTTTFRCRQAGMIRFRY